jgi:hypothetical protein
MEGKWYSGMVGFQTEGTPLSPDSSVVFLPFLGFLDVAINLAGSQAGLDKHRACTRAHSRASASQSDPDACMHRKSVK